MCECSTSEHSASEENHWIIGRNFLHVAVFEGKTPQNVRFSAYRIRLASDMLAGEVERPKMTKLGLDGTAIAVPDSNRLAGIHPNDHFSEISRAGDAL